MKPNYKKTAIAILTSRGEGIPVKQFAISLTGQQIDGSTQTAVKNVIKTLVREEVIEIRANQTTFANNPNKLIDPAERVYLHPSQVEAVELVAELPALVYEALTDFLKANKAYDFNEAISAAVALFLMQKGVQHPAIRKQYLQQIEKDLRVAA